MEKPSLYNKHKNIVAIVIFSSAIIFLSVLFCFVGYLSKNYNDVYKMQKNIHTVVDFTNYDIENDVISTNLYGEFEFFYNKWIVSENYSGEPDAIVSVPHRWTGTVVNGKKLDAKGYASYRVYAKGLKAGTSFRLYLDNYIGSYRAYVNGECVGECGIMSKTGESKANGSAEKEKWYTVKSDDEILQIVVEISNSSEGGLHACPWMTCDTNIFLHWSARSVGYIMLGIMLMVFIFTIIINVTKIKDEKQWSHSLLILVLLLQFFFSSDVYWLFCSAFKTYSFNIVANVNYLLGIALIFVGYYYLKEVGVLKRNKVFLIVSAIVVLCSSIAYFALCGNKFRIIPVIISASITLYFLFPIAQGIADGKRINFAYLCLFLTIFTSFINTMIDFLDVINFGVEIISSIILMISVLITTLLYFINLRSDTSRIIQSLIIQEENRTVRADALKAQIKPHFVFNNLTNIQNLYKQSLEQGDEALMKFSKHLRVNVEAEGRDLIKFKDELENILNYTDLENLRRIKKVNLLLDCEEYDFLVPILSLQPFIENSFKYSEVEEKADGYVEIKSYKNEQGYVVEINDNGKGFDVSNIKPTSTGLKNATSRLKLISKAEVIINSSFDFGTHIKIIFFERLNNENSYS